MDRYVWTSNHLLLSLIDSHYNRINLAVPLKILFDSYDEKLKATFPSLRMSDALKGFPALDQAAPFSRCLNQAGVNTVQTFPFVHRQLPVASEA